MLERKGKGRGVGAQEYGLGCWSTRVQLGVLECKGTSKYVGAQGYE